MQTLFIIFLNTTKPFYLETTKSKTPNAIVGEENSLQVISSKLRANFPPMRKEERYSRDKNMNETLEQRKEAKHKSLGGKDERNSCGHKSHRK